MKDGSPSIHHSSLVIQHLIPMSSNSFMRRSRSLLSFGGWRDLVSDSMAIDIGSTSVIIAVRGRGVVVDEPAVVAVNKMSGEAVADGREAHDMLGRESRDVSLVS